MKSIENKILKRINKFGKGNVFTPNDFLDIGSRQAVDISLHRLLKKDIIRRISRGVYDYPNIDTELGMLSPSIDSITTAIISRDNIQIQLSGEYAANKLGLSDHIPMRIVFYSNGSQHKIKFGKRIIEFKHTTQRIMATANRISGTVIQALRFIGKNNVDDNVIGHLSQQLTREEKKQLILDVKYAPIWLGNILRRIATHGDTQ